MPPVPLDETGQRWWTWAGHDVDLMAEPGEVPGLVRPAILAQRDAETEDDTDMADFLAWLVEQHPPWLHGCTACGTSIPCQVQTNAHEATSAWLVDRSQRLVAQIRNPGRRWRIHAPQ